MWKTTLSSLGQISDLSEMVARYICLLCAVGMAALVNLAVFYRYVLNDPLFWPEELARFLMVWITFIGGSIALRRGSLFSFTIISGSLSGRIAHYYNVIVNMASLIFICWFLFYGLDALKLYSKFTSMATGITYYWSALGLFIGAVLMISHIVLAIFRNIDEIVRNENKTGGRI